QRVYVPLAATLRMITGDVVEGTSLLATRAALRRAGRLKVITAVRTHPVGHRTPPHRDNGVRYRIL
ncbi:MAG TPA: hypothetical protein VJ565_02200, partial [Dehalococcoidia bacterium]|nr:hypothetical protein [Dehalococcoidia bacterium]